MGQRAQVRSRSGAPPVQAAREEERQRRERHHQRLRVTGDHEEREGKRDQSPEGRNHLSLVAALLAH